MSQLDTASTTLTPPPPAAAQSGEKGTEINSMRLLGDQGLLRIAHKGAIYTLRATSKGGLILTK